MPLPLLPAAIQGGLALAQLAGGALKKSQRPEYKIPDSLKQSLALSKIRAMDPNMAGYGEAKTNIDLSTANTIQAATQSGNAQESLAAIMGQESTSLRNLAAQNEASQRADVQDYGRELSEYSRYEDMKFQLNELDPYKDAAQEKRDIVGAGIENLFGAADKFSPFLNRGMPKSFSNKVKPRIVPTGSSFY